MSNSFNRTIVAVLAAVTLLVGVITNYKTVLYIHDWILGTYIEIAEMIFPSSDTLTMVQYDSFRTYIHTYRDLPPGFIHAGSLLLYRAAEDTDLDDMASDISCTSGHKDSGNGFFLSHHEPFQSNKIIRV